ncbi:MAG: DNA polymerase I [Methylococcales bacterium]|nr:DNA polymerase I [Methylococcales bacterium]
MADKESCVLVDGSSYLFRAFHAMGPLTNSKGEPTGAILGVMNMLKKLLEQHPSEYIAIIFDAKGKTFRHDRYPEYKANRSAAPDDLVAQIPALHDIIRSLGLPLICVSGVEADDVIGTLSQQADREGITCKIISSDKDLTQLVNDNTCMIDTMKDKTMDIAAVSEKFGVGPELMGDFLALVGDTSDNIPGVPKVGPKTATKWLNLYSNLEGVVNHAGEIKGKVGEYLRDNLEQLALSKELVTLDCNVSLTETIHSLTRQPLDLVTLLDYCERFEFRTWQREVIKWQEATPDANVVTALSIETHYQTITEQADFLSWMETLKQAGTFAFDTETNSLDARHADLIGLSFSCEEGTAAYVPVGHDYEGAPQQLDRDWVIEHFKPLLADTNLTKIAHNIKYDQVVLQNYGVTIAGSVYDTMLESYIYKSTSTRHNMDVLAEKYLQIHTTHFEDIAGKGVKQKLFNEIDITDASPYAAEDADITLRLHHFFWGELENEIKLKTLIEELEMPIASLLAKIEANGVLVDAEELHAQSEVLHKQIVTLQAKAYDIAEEEFNIGSPKQVQHILYEKMGLPIKKRTAKKQPSTAVEALTELALDYPLPKIILEYRELSKLKSTYTDSLPKKIDDTTGRVHTSYNQAVAETGRLSSSNPNLQNIPIRSENGRRIRNAFIAPPGKKILAADYSQIELRIMAHLSGDETMLKAFASGEDIHKATAAEVFGVALEDVTPFQRRSAKAINFGLMYGKTAFGLAQDLKISRTEAQNYIERYFSRYPGADKLIETLKDQARKEGVVETLWGRRWHLPNIMSRSFQNRAHDERTAINAPMQGTAADIIKKAMLLVDEWIVRDQPPVTMIMQVHDELVFEVDENAVEEVTPIIKKLMSQAADLKVPLDVDVGVGDNWQEAH